MHPIDRLALGLAMIGVLTLIIALVARMSLVEAVSLYCLFAAIWVLRCTLWRGR